jgi:hypothetical protein
MSSKRLWLALAGSVLAAGPAGGFLFGLLNAGDPDPNPIGRVVYAFLMAVETPLHAGFPPDPQAGVGQTYNVWPHIAVAFVLLWSGFVYRAKKSAKKPKAPSA